VHGIREKIVKAAKGGTKMARRVKIVLDMDATVWQDIDEFAASRGWDGAEFVRRALGTERFLLEQEDAGAVVYLRAPNAEHPLNLYIGAVLPQATRPAQFGNL